MPTILPFWYRGVAVDKEFLKSFHAHTVQDTCPWGAFVSPEPLDTVEWFTARPTRHRVIL
jgi:hypothetical protein